MRTAPKKKKKKKIKKKPEASFASAAWIRFTERWAAIIRMFLGVYLRRQRIYKKKMDMRGKRRYEQKRTRKECLASLADDNVFGYDSRGVRSVPL